MRRPRRGLADRMAGARRCVLPDRLEVELRQGDAADARSADLSAGPGWEERLGELRSA